MGVSHKNKHLKVNYLKYGDDTFRSLELKCNKFMCSAIKFRKNASKTQEDNGDAVSRNIRHFEIDKSLRKFYLHCFCLTSDI